MARIYPDEPGFLRSTCSGGLTRDRIASVPPAEERRQEPLLATLGDVLYADTSKALVPEQDWERLVRAVARGDQLALHALYDRAHRVVFTLAVRITCSRETAEEVTLDVFHDVWRRAQGYDAANGTVLGWIMNQARSRAIDRVRFEQRQKRLDPRAGSALPAEEAADTRDAVELLQQREVLQRAVGELNPAEREALEAAFFSGLTYAEAALHLQQPLGTVKTRIRSALHKLREALTAEGEGP
ncbi:MAG TPA: sigma-70 family RNA polymerase sigma factor [Ramlibacter sp.]|uniref:sigma-70 family RNA polymerase sigma factor n=1 Tax=Ramlibacter sp. TaxID=1917967 RepID=UPI002D80405B|nr:sigma-70 family RNA polymerase sigma factor [Ramlibacter sp.]HET8746407.1 sigma-70 family RNA polymerase sigma factor [Ramlibacter sp.]